MPIGVRRVNTIWKLRSGGGSTSKKRSLRDYDAEKKELLQQILDREQLDLNDEFVYNQRNVGDVMRLYRRTRELVRSIPINEHGDPDERLRETLAFLHNLSVIHNARSWLRGEFHDPQAGTGPDAYPAHMSYPQQEEREPPGTPPDLREAREAAARSLRDNPG